MLYISFGNDKIICQSCKSGLKLARHKSNSFCECGRTTYVVDYDRVEYSPKRGLTFLFDINGVNTSVISFNDNVANRYLFTNYCMINKSAEQLIAKVNSLVLI